MSRKDLEALGSQRESLSSNPLLVKVGGTGESLWAWLVLCRLECLHCHKLRNLVYDNLRGLNTVLRDHVGVYMFS